VKIRAIRGKQYYQLHRIIFMPTPTPIHQLISSELHILLGYHIQKHPLGKLIAAVYDASQPRELTQIVCILKRLKLLLLSIITKQYS
jgi:hypothetical protein